MGLEQIAGWHIFILIARANDMQKIKEDRYRSRWLDTRKTGNYWVPSALSTNSLKIAQKWCDENHDDQRQIWDYKDLKALTPTDNHEV